MEIIQGIPVCGEVDNESLEQLKRAFEFSGQYCALMADHHIGYSVPIGGVIAYEGKICVNGVGFDIACGNKAVCLNVDAQDVRNNIYRTMNEVQKHIRFGIGKTNNEIVTDDELFDDPLWGQIDFLGDFKTKARAQLGTVGSGNHYVDIFVDDVDRVWVGVHFGSRGLGHTIATRFIQMAGGADGIHADPVILHENSDLGEQYLKCMDLAGRYAYSGRNWVCSRVAQILRGTIISEVHNHHNFAWKENHYGRDLWVVRKGATPAFPGQKGFVGGSMGEHSVILEGVDHADCKPLLHSTVHGAGRTLGRSQAKGTIDRRTGVVKRPGLVSKGDMDAWIKKFDVELRGSDVDEAPQCYKRLEHVLSAHHNTIKVLHRLKPIGVCMASQRDIDPYKD